MSGAHYPNEDSRPVTCSACVKLTKPYDGKGHENCRTGAEASHRIYFKDHDKPLINKGK